MPLPHERLHERRLQPHEEVMELVDRRFDEIMEELAEIRRRLR